MGFTLNLKGQTVSEGNSNFAPLAAGNYLVSVFDAEVGEYSPKSNNPGRPNLKVQLRIADGQKGANRRQFETIPLFTRFNRSDKSPDGADAFTFFGFFAAILGIPEKEFRKQVTEAIANADDDGNVELPIPDPQEILGKELVLNLKVENDAYAYNKYVKGVENGEVDDEGLTKDDFKRNAVQGFRPASSFKGEAASGGSIDSAKAGFITL